MTMKHKTRTERVYNETTGWYETREVELKGYTFTDDDRILIVREYLESGVAAEKIIKKYHISSRSVLFSWMDKFLNEKDLLPLQPEPDEDEMANRSKDSYKEENAQLKKRIRELEKALQFSRLETLARDLMIDKAEEYFDVPIRKKSGAKQP